MNVVDVPIKNITITENVRLNVRDTKLQELMESIKQHGLKQPIGAGKKDATHYTLLYGSRRLQACKKLGWKTIPASVEQDPTLVDLLTVNMIENLHRADINPAELGRMCLRLLKLDMTEGEVATRLSIPVNRVKAAMNIFRQIPETIRKKVRYMPYGVGMKEGYLSAALATEAINIRKVHALSPSQFESLLEAIRKQEMVLADLNIVAALMKDGMTVEQAIKERQKWTTYRINITAAKGEVDKLASGSEQTENRYIKEIVYGGHPALKRPKFNY